MIKKDGRWNSWILCNTLTSNRYRKKPRNCRSCSLKKTLIIIIHIYINLYCFNVLKGKFECLVNQDSLSCVAKPLFPEWACPMVPKTPGITIPTMDQQGVRSRDIGVFLEIWGTSQNHSKLVLFTLKGQRSLFFYIAYMVISNISFRRIPQLFTNTHPTRHVSHICLVAPKVPDQWRYGPQGS